MTRLWQASVAMILGLATLSPTLAQQGGNRVQANRANNNNIQQAADLINQQQAAAQVNPNAGVNPAQGVNALPGQGFVPNPPNNLGNNMQGQPFVNPNNLLDEFGAPLQGRQNELGQQNQALLNRAQRQQQRQQNQSQQNNSDNSGQMGQGSGFVGGGFIGGGLDGAATIEESILTGQARTMQAAGEYNRNSAEGARTLELAKAIALENARTSLKTYFELKDMNAQYQAKRTGGPLSKEKLDEWNRQDQPKRLTRAEYNIDSGAIRWPDLLMVNAFADQRVSLEELFARRSASEFGPKSEFYRHVSGHTQILKDRLKDYLRSNEKFFSDEEYVAAQNFLSSLAHEARVAPSLDGLAAN